MRNRSNVESFASGEITLQAIAETICAIGLGMAVVLLFDTYLFMAVSACIAPFLLLRTEKSVQAGLSMGNFLVDPLRHWSDYLDKTESSRQLQLAINILSLGILFVLFLPVILLISRVCGILYAVLNQSIPTTLTAIPRNWKLQVLCLDIGHPLEVLPGVERAVAAEVGGFLNLKDFTFGELIRDLRRLRNEKKRIVFLLVWFPLLFLAIFPAWIYRWSLKSTAWAYSPLLWIIMATFSASLDLRQRLRDIRTAEIARLARLFSAILIVLFVAKLAAIHAGVALAAALREVGMEPFFFLIEPTIVPPWQWAVFVNALLAWALFLFAGRRLEMIALMEKEPPPWVDRILRGFVFVRTSLTVYIIPITLYLLVLQASNWNWPPLGDKIFPWW